MRQHEILSHNYEILSLNGDDDYLNIHNYDASQFL